MDIEKTKPGRLIHFLIAISFTITSLFSICCHASNATSQALDIVFTIDSSKSMVISDQEALRKSALKLFLALLAPEDRAAVVSFSEDGYIFQSMTMLDSASNKELLFDAIDRLSSKGGYTNFYGALENAKNIVSDNRESDRKSIVLLITDGHMELSSTKETSSQQEQC